MTVSALPRSRPDGIVVQEVDGELVVYDLETNDVHCLDAVSAFVWRRCDGVSTPAGVAGEPRSELGLEADTGLVLGAVEQLRAADLLDDDAPIMSRGTLFRRSAAVAALVTTVVAPAALAAGSCAGPGEDCSNVPCCPAQDLFCIEITPGQNRCQAV